jgi:hypothetical protein
VCAQAVKTIDIVSKRYTYCVVVIVVAADVNVSVYFFYLLLLFQRVFFIFFFFFNVRRAEDADSPLKSLKGQFEERTKKMDHEVATFQKKVATSKKGAPPKQAGFVLHPQTVVNSAFIAIEVGCKDLQLKAKALGKTPIAITVRTSLHSESFGMCPPCLFVYVLECTHHVYLFTFCNCDFNAALTPLRPSV